MLYDIIIIGSGPAGLTAAIYAKRAELNFIIIEKEGMSGGQLVSTTEIDNYPGMPGIGGFELSIKLREHAEKLGAIFIMGEVIDTQLEGAEKVITLDNHSQYTAKTVLIATGGVPRHLSVEGEEKLTGVGVSYCATCDGAFFKNKVVAVAGGGDVAVEDAIFLARICKQVYVIHRRDEFRAAKYLSKRLLALENVTVLWDSVVEKINGIESVNSIDIKNIKTQESKSYDISGIFIAIGYMPNSEGYNKAVATDDSGYIIAGENCETNVPGVFAVGDVRTKVLRQIITAEADGANAITAVEKHLNNQ